MIEDVHLIARDRQDLETPIQESLLNPLLNEMHGLREHAEVLFILTTNRPRTLERALAGRPGRIDQAVEFPLPDDSGRRRLIDLYRRQLVLPEEVMEEAVRRTDGVSPACIKELMRRTAQQAAERDAETGTAVRADLDSALAHAEDAESLQGWAASPHLQLALVEEQRDDLANQLAALSTDNEELSAQLGRVADEKTAQARALEADYKALQAETETLRADKDTLADKLAVVEVELSVAAVFLLVVPAPPGALPSACSPVVSVVHRSMRAHKPSTRGR